jgi:cyclic beta-1,2-glucan synthetase
LFDRENRVVKLFDPPFDGAKNPGYIKGYARGFRENGGQYTHAAVWLALAQLERGDARGGLDTLLALLPSERGDAYRAEPYVLAADVYANPEHVGRGGWSWYTGAAGWYLRAVVEGLFGVTVRGGEVTAVSRVPQGFGSFRVTLKIGGKMVVITENGETADDN